MADKQDTISTVDLAKPDPALEQAKKQAQIYQAGEAYPQPAKPPPAPSPVADQGPELIGTNAPQTGSLATASQPQNPPLQPQSSQGEPQGGNLAATGRPQPPQQQPPQETASGGPAAPPQPQEQQPAQPQPSDSISAQDLGQGISAKDLITPDLVNNTVESYKTATNIQNAFSSGQITQEVANSAITQLQKTYQSASPEQKKAMDAAETEAEKQLQPKAQDQETSTSPAADTFASLLVAGTPFNFAKLPVQQVQNYVDDQYNQHKLTDAQYADALAEIKKAKYIFQNDPRMTGGVGLGATKASTEQMLEAEKEIAAHLDLAAPGFLASRPQQALGELTLAGKNLPSDWKTLLTSGPKFNQPIDQTGPGVPILEKSAGQLQASLQQAFEAHQANAARFNLSDQDQQRVDAAMKSRGLIPQTPQEMAQKNMLPKAGASTGGLPLVEQGAMLAASMIPMPWDPLVDAGVAKLLQGAAVPVSATGRVLEQAGAWTMKRAGKTALGGLTTGAATAGMAFALHPQEFMADLNNPEKRTQTLEILAAELGLPVVGGALLGSGLWGAGNSAKFIASVMRSASPEIRLAMEPGGVRALSTEIPYRATQGPVQQVLGRSLEAYLSGVGKGVPFAAAQSQGDIKQFVNDVNQFGMYGALFRAPQSIVDALRGGNFDHIFTYKGENPNATKAPPISRYGDSYYDPLQGGHISLDPYVKKAFDSLDDSRAATLAHVQDITKPYANIYPLPDEVYAHVADGQGANADSAGFVNHDPYSGKIQAFFKASKFDPAALHEAVGHVAYRMMGPQNQAGFNHLLSQVVDMDNVANTYANRANPGTGKVTFSQLPDDAEVTPNSPQYDPTKAQWAQDHGNLTKQRAYEEAGAETLQALYSGKTAEQWTKNPSLLRRFAYFVGSSAEGLGFRTTTPDVNGPLGVNKSVAAAKILDAYLHDFATGNIPPGGATKNYFGNRVPIQTGPTPTPPGGRPPPGGTPPPGGPTIIRGGGGGSSAGGGGAAVPPAAPTGFATAKPANVLAVRGGMAQQRQLPGPMGQAPPPAPGAEPKGPEVGPEAIPEPAQAQADESVVQGLMKQGFTRQQAQDFAARGTVSPVHGAPRAQPVEPQVKAPAQEHAQIEEEIKKGTPACEAQAKTQGRAPQTLAQTGEEPAHMPAGKGDFEFTPSTEWQDVPEHLAVPVGGNYRVNVTTGARQARWDKPPGPETVVDTRTGKPQQPTPPNAPSSQEATAHMAAGGKVDESIDASIAANRLGTGNLDDPRIPAEVEKIRAERAQQQQLPPVKRADQAPAQPLEQPKGPDAATRRVMRATWFGRNPDGSVDTTDEGRMSFYNAHHGAWGADLLDKNLEGIAVSSNFLRANGIDPRKSPGSQGFRARVTAPNGETVDTDIVDIGPENKVDMTYGLGKRLGLNDNSQLSVQLLDHQGKTIALRDKPEGGEAPAHMPGGGGGSAAAWTPSRGPAPTYPWSGGGAQGGGPPAAPGGEETAARAPAAAYPTQMDTEPENVPTSPVSYYSGGEGGGAAQMPNQAEQMAQYQGSYGGGFGYGQIIPGIVPGAPSYMPAPRRKMGGLEPEEEGGAPVESTLGEPNVRGFEQLTPHLSQGTAGLKRAQALHTNLLSPDDTRVRKQADNMFKGEHFLKGDPVHMAALSDVPQNERLALAAGQTAIANKQPMHITYASAPPSAGKQSPLTRQSREVNYDESSPQARMLGQTNARLAGHSFIPTAIGVSTSRKAGQPNNGYIQGISTSVAAHNHFQLNKALGEMGQESPYPELNSPKFRNDLSGYVQNLLAGHRGTGNKYQVGTAEYPANPDRNYVPYRLKQREADFLNAVINNQAARHSKGLQELARKGGTLLTEEGETNPIRHAIDASHAGLRGGAPEEIHDAGIKNAARERWSKEILEPTIRTFNAGLIHSLHESREHIPQEIRPTIPGYEELTKTLGRELTTEKGRPDIAMAAAFMPSKKRPKPLSSEEHEELTGNIRKQFLSGKLRAADYLDRLGDVPEPGEEIGPAHMPMAGKKARGFEQAEKEGRTFETPLPGGGKRFEIDDRDMEFKPASRSGQEDLAAKNALHERYLSDTRGPGIMPLSDAIRHPDLFQNYPFLRNTKVSMDPTIRHSGHYEPPWVDDEGTPRGDHIVLQTSDDKRTMAHEIQHAVQHYENFAGQGANSADIYRKMRNDTGVRDELDKVWASAYPERNDMSNEDFAQNEKLRTGWQDKRMKEMAHAMYHMEPGEIEARVAGERAMRQPEQERQEAEQRLGLRPMAQNTPAQDVLYEMRAAELEGRRSAILSPSNAPFPKEQLTGVKPRSEAPGIHYMPASKKTKEPLKISQKTQKQLGPRPEDEEQGNLWDKVAARLDKQIEGAIPLRPARKANGDFKTNSLKQPEYEEETGGYHLANAPILGKKALGYDKKGSVNKAPEGTVDKLDPGDLDYLNPTDRLRVSHLNEISAIDTYADALGKEYERVEKEIPEALKAKDWYNDTEGYLKKHFGEDADMVANLLAATSARTGVKTNYGFAMNAYHRFARGDYDRHIDLYQKAYDMKQREALAQHVLDAGIHHEMPSSEAHAMALYIKHHDILPVQHNLDNPEADYNPGGLGPEPVKGPQYGMNSLPVLKVLARTWLNEVGGPKTPRYTGNMTGRTIQSTGDMWVGRQLRRLGFEGHTKEPWLIQPPAEPGLTNLDFAIQELAHRKAAAKRGLEPRQHQAILWTSEIKHWLDKGWAEGGDPAERDYRPMLKEYKRPEWAKRAAA